MTKRHRLLLAISCLLFASPAAHALAQQSDEARRASARSLFEQGMELATAQQWEEATDRFQRALTLQQSSVIAFNLAASLAELGRLVEATEHLHTVVRDDEAKADLRGMARERLASLEKRLAHLTVRVDGNIEGDRIKLDGEELAMALIDVEQPIDPGGHALAAFRDGEALRQLEFEAPEGARLEQQLDLHAVPTAEEVATAAAVDEPLQQDPPSEDHAITERWWFWAGVGAALIGTAAITAAVASSGDEPSNEYAGDFEPGFVRVEVMP